MLTKEQLEEAFILYLGLLFTFRTLPDRQGGRRGAACVEYDDFTSNFRRDEFVDLARREFSASRGMLEEHPDLLFAAHAAYHECLREYRLLGQE